MFWNLVIPVHFAIAGVLSGILKNESQRCSSSEFSCSDGTCVNVHRVCDGVADCVDHSEETICLPGNNSSLVVGDVYSRAKRQSNCGKQEWRCKDGSCIPFYGKCDGVADCLDGSDETHALCRKSDCQDNLFRCTYGACVDGTAPCNGIQECVDNSDELLPSCTNKSRVVKGRFKCDNGQEISSLDVCDGERNCDDGSDETINVCAGRKCESYLFQCAYGACVDGFADCNGRQECADGSDESDELCNRTTTAVVTVRPVTTTPSVSSGGCKLPPYPANGRYSIRGRPNDVPGQPFQNVLSLTVTCDQGYAVNGNNSILIACFPGIDLDVPKCKPYCDLAEHRSVEYECETRMSDVTETRPCRAREFFGTTVRPKCRTPNYRGSPSYMHCTENGWDYVATCKPECGRKTPFGKEYIIDGRRAEQGEIPWHAAIYSKMFRPNKQICGGTLVSTTAVITAAHCFWDDIEGKKPTENYTVALGKIFRPYADKHDEAAQYSDIDQIYIPQQFRGAKNNFQFDIAILILKTEITYKTFIRPVCVSFDQSLKNLQLKPESLGTIAGWGLTGPNGKESPVLQVVELPFVTYDQCFDESPTDFQEYITGDKICAGYRNGTALCQGDSGGGLAFPTVENNVIRYYLRGIVSTAPRNNMTCDPYQRTTFTDVTSHEYFIKNNVYIEGA